MRKFDFDTLVSFVVGLMAICCVVIMVTGVYLVNTELLCIGFIGSMVLTTCLAWKNY